MPSEHGSWGFVLEPLVLSLIVAYSLPGLLLSLCTFFMFLSHQPIKNLFKRKNINPNKKISQIFLAIYFLFILTFFAIVLFQVSLTFLIPFGISLIVMINYLFTLYNQKNRKLVNELSAPVSISLIALSIVLFDGWQIENVIAFWFILLARSIPTTFYVHAKLLMIKKKSAKKGLPILLGGIFTIILLLFSIFSYSPYLAAAASLLLLIRAYTGLYASKHKVKIRTFGIWEFIYGGLFVLIVTVGYQLKL